MVNRSEVRTFIAGVAVYGVLRLIGHIIWGFSKFIGRLIGVAPWWVCLVTVVMGIVWFQSKSHEIAQRNNDPSAFDNPDLSVKHQIGMLERAAVARFREQHPDLAWEDYRPSDYCLGRRSDYVCFYRDPNPWATVKMPQTDRNVSWSHGETYGDGYYVHAIPTMMPPVTLLNGFDSDQAALRDFEIAAVHARDIRFDFPYPDTCGGYREDHWCAYQTKNEWATIKVQSKQFTDTWMIDGEYVHELPTLELVERAAVAQFRDLMDDASFTYTAPQFCTGALGWRETNYTCFYTAPNTWANKKASNGYYVHAIDPTSQVTLVSDKQVAATKHFNYMSPIIVAISFIGIWLGLRFLGGRDDTQPKRLPMRLLK